MIMKNVSYTIMLKIKKYLNVVKLLQYKNYDRYGIIIALYIL